MRGLPVWRHPHARRQYQLIYYASDGTLEMARDELRLTMQTAPPPLGAHPGARPRIATGNV